MADFGDLTLDELRVALAPAVAESAVFDGWSEAAVHAAADLRGVDPDVAMLAYPGGAMDMIAAWIASVDTAMAAAFPPRAGMVRNSSRNATVSIEDTNCSAEMINPR